MCRRYLVTIGALKVYSGKTALEAMGDFFVLGDVSFVLLLVVLCIVL